MSLFEFLVDKPDVEWIYVLSIERQAEIPVFEDFAYQDGRYCIWWWASL